MIVIDSDVLIEILEKNLKREVKRSSVSWKARRFRYHSYNSELGHVWFKQTLKINSKGLLKIGVFVWCVCLFNLMVVYNFLITLRVHFV